MGLPWGCGRPSLTRHAWGLLTSLVILLFLWLGSAQLRVEGPGHPVTATVGQDVVLPCHLSPRKDARTLEVRWIRRTVSETVHHYLNGEDLYGEQMGAYAGRTELSRDGLSAGSLDLRVTRVRPSDDGQYVCTVKDVNAYHEAIVELEVSATGADPHLSLGGYEAGGVRVLCRSAGWYPLPQLLWRDARGQHLPSVSQTHSQDQEGLFEIESAVIMTRTVEGPLSCVVRSSRLQHERESSLHIAAPFFLNAQLLIEVLVLVLVLLAVSIGLGVNLFRKKAAQSRELGAKLAEVTAELDEYRSRTAYYSARLKEQAEELAQKNERLLELAAELVEKDARLARQSAGLQEQAAELLKKDAKIKEQAAGLVKKDAEFAEQAAELAELSAELVEKDARLVHQFARLQEQAAELVKKDAKIKEQAAGLVKKDAEFAEQAAELAWRKFLIPQNPVKLTLDPYTAHPRLILSEAFSSVRWESQWQQVPDSQERFDRWCCVLGREAFREGRHCWLVEVEGEHRKCSWWAVGVARASVERKKRISICPEEGIWAVQYDEGQLMSLTTPPTPLSLSPVPTRIWVCLDCTQQQVSFINTDNGVEIFTFTAASFNGESIRPWFLLETPGIQLCLRDSTL